MVDFEQVNVNLDLTTSKLTNKSYISYLQIFADLYFSIFHEHLIWMKWHLMNCLSNSFSTYVFYLQNQIFRLSVFASGFVPVAWIEENVNVIVQLSN